MLLRLKGYKILDLRARTPRGEIDIVACKRRIICFIEVKARKRNTYAAEAVTPHNWARIAEAAAIWMQHHPHYTDYGWRYDLIAMGKRQWPLHIQDAWRPGD